MATTPEKEIAAPTIQQRIAQQVPARARVVAILAAIAAAGSLSPEPFAAIVTAGSVIVAWDYGRRR